MARQLFILLAGMSSRNAHEELFNIELNENNNGGWTAFHCACMNGNSKIAEMLMKNCAGFNIDLNTKDSISLYLGMVNQR